MRHSWVILVVGLALFAGCSGYDRELLGDPEPEPSEAVEESVEGEPVEFEGYQQAIVSPADSLDMYAELRFYGSWYSLHPYGWVWRPIVTHDWAPMVEGHWVWTSFGWMWIPYEPFGAITYTYGFWVNDFALGWVWVPDSHWAAARCEWAIWDDVISWCPLAPPGVHYDDPWQPGDYPWVTVPVAKFKDAQVGRNRVAPRFKGETSERTLRRSAPDPATIERGTGQGVRITPVELVEGNLTHVVLPADQQRIVNEQRSKSKQSPFVPPPPGDTNIAGPPPPNSDNPKTDDRPAKGKDTPSPPPAKKGDPPKFKEKAKEEKPKSDSESKKKG
jgi:hypothetical protein